MILIPLRNGATTRLDVSELNRLIVVVVLRIDVWPATGLLIAAADDAKARYAGGYR